MELELDLDVLELVFDVEVELAFEVVELVCFVVELTVEEVETAFEVDVGTEADLGRLEVVDVATCVLVEVEIAIVELSVIQLRPSGNIAHCVAIGRRALKVFSILSEPKRKI